MKSAFKGNKQHLQGMRARDELAQGVGQKLGTCALLFGGLP